jgi:hypothetical protein
MMRQKPGVARMTSEEQTIGAERNLDLGKTYGLLGWGTILRKKIEPGYVEGELSKLRRRRFGSQGVLLSVERLQRPGLSNKKRRKGSFRRRRRRYGLGLDAL